MEIPLQIAFHGLEPSPALEDRIRQKAGSLDRFHPHIMSCHVTVEAPHRRRHKGMLFRVRIDITLPGTDVVIGRDHQDRHEHEDAYVAVRDAFDEAVRRVEDQIRLVRADTKSHEVPPHGRVAFISHREDYGFIHMPDDREVYFHRNSLLEGSFDRLQVGEEVRFVLHEPNGEQGPHASSVRVIGKHHLPPIPVVR